MTGPSYSALAMRRWRDRHPGAGSAAVARWKASDPAGYLLRKSKDRARLKGLAFDLDRKWMSTRLERCEVTGLPFDLTRAEVGSNPWSPSVDRRDSSKGYTKTNCRVVVWMYNVAKSTWTDEEVMRMAQAIVK